MKNKKKHYIVLLAIIGTFFLLWKGIFAPWILQLPEDFKFEARLVSIDNLYNEEKGRFNGSVYSRAEYIYETLEVDNNDALIRSYFNVETVDGDSLFSVERTYGVNRKTGEHQSGIVGVDRSGYLFAPKNLKPGTPFTYWHINYNGPAEMIYVGKEMINGLETYRYQSRYEGVAIDQTENLMHLPGVGITRGVELEPFLELWIEPVTGRMVKYHDDTTAYFYNLETRERLNPWNHFSNEFDQSSIEKNVKELQLEKLKHAMVGVYIPLFCLLAMSYLVIMLLGLKQKARSLLDSKAFLVALVILISSWPALSFIRWAFKWENFEFLSQKYQMNPLTALSLLGLFLGILSLFKRWRSGSYYFGLIIATIGSVRLASIYEWIDFDVDLLFFGAQVLSADTPSRMGAFTSIGLITLGLALVTEQRKKLQKIHAAEILSSICFLFSALIVIAHILDLNRILEISIFFSVSVSTALLFLVASLIIFIFFHKKNELSIRFSGWAMLSSILLVSVLSTVIVTSIAENSFSNEAKTKFEIEIGRTLNALEERLNIYINILNGGRGFMNGSENVERDEWKRYVDSLNVEENYPGIQGLGYSIFVKPEDKAQHIQSIRDEGFPDYEIKPEGSRNIYTSIIYLEPFDLRNQQAFGYDMFSNDVRRLAMELARDTGGAKMSGRITLVQEIDQDVQPGFLIYVPVYSNESRPKSLEERQKLILGYVYSAFRARNFVEGVIGKDGLDGISLTIYDGTRKRPSSELYNDNQNHQNLSDGPVFESTRTIYVAGRPWTLTFESEPGYGINLINRITPIVIVLIGVAISFLIALIVYTLASSQQRAVAYGQKLTQKLQAEKARDEAILASIGEGLIVVDKKGKITLVNRMFEQLTGWKANEVRGKSLPEVIPMFDKKGKRIPISKRIINQTLKKRIKSHKEKNSILYYQRKNGTRFPIDLIVSPISIQSEFIGAVEVFKNIAKEIEIDKAKTEFVSLASHQLRTPLTSVKLFMELLWSEIKKKATKTQKKYFENIDFSTKRMIQLVNDLLNVSRLESGKMSVKTELTDLDNYIKSVITEMDSIAKNKGVKITYSRPKEKLKKVPIDPSLFHEVLICLMSNAIRYTEKNRGLIEVSLQKKSKTYRIEVKDNGIGIPKLDQKKLFKKFFRADNAIKKEADGSGLGLYIASMIMGACGGKIGFRSSGKGSIFYITLPLNGMKSQKGEKRIAT